MSHVPDGGPGQGGASRVGAGILLSRLLGFLRDRIFAFYFGSSDYADAWGAALRLPNVLRNLLGEGTLSASMIPIYARYVEDGEEEAARRFAGAVLGLLAAVAGVMTLVGVALAPWMVAVFFPRWTPEKQALTTTLVRILFPMSGIFVLSAWAMGVLDSHRRFFVSYAAPALWNVALIAAMVMGGMFWGLGQRDLVVLLAWGALAGGAAQFLVQLPFVLHHLGGLRLSMGRDVPGVREAVRNFVPVVSARGVVNLSGWFEVFLAGLLAPGAVAVMRYAQTFYMLPISLFGISIAASELPELSRLDARTREALAGRVSLALRRVAYFLIPSTVGYLLLGDVVVAALFQTGAFGEAETLVTWGVLGAFALGLPATASSRALSSAFYALRDTRTPARVAYLRVGLSLVLGVALMFPLDRLGVGGLHLGAAGLALGGAGAAWLEYALLRRGLRRRIGRHGPGVMPVLRMGGAAALAAAVGVGIQLILPPAHPLLVALETLVPFGVVYLGMAGRGLRAGSAEPSGPGTGRR